MGILPCAAAVAAALFAGSACAQPGASAARTAPQAPTAARWAQPEKSMLLASARARDRIVAVGERGLVLLSQDGGATYRQAKSVPTRATLTAVSFADGMHGWAVGHRGTILATADGGETWKIQREDAGIDQPLFAVWFADGQHGFAGGLWSLLLATDDGGRTWREVKLAAPGNGGKADRNLFHIFGAPQGAIFIAAERGAVLRSKDGGLTWQELATGNRGSFWAGCVLRSGVILVGGLQGRVYRSSDGGERWSEIASGTKSSITSIAQMDDGRVMAVGLDGVTLESRDQGLTFRVETRADRLALTSVLGGPAPVYLSVRGVLPPAPR